MKKIVENLTGLRGRYSMPSADLERLNDTTNLNVDKLESVYKQLLQLRDALKTNEDVDWGLEDANWEFQELTKMLNGILGVPEVCENFTSLGDCSSIDNGRWHNETLQQLGDEYEVAIDCVSEVRYHRLEFSVADGIFERWVLCGGDFDLESYLESRYTSDEQSYIDAYVSGNTTNAQVEMFCNVDTFDTLCEGGE